VGRLKARLNPHYIQLVCDACLKSFWRKRALAKFLKACKISDRFLATWGSDETKRDLLDRLFDELPRSDKGRAALLRIAKYLMEQDSFPDLDNWEDSKDKKAAARESVTRLKRYHRAQEAEILSEEDRRAAQKRFREHQKQVAVSQLSLQKLNDRLGDLGNDLGSPKAGYAFQDWFYELVDFSEVTNRRPYVTQGRQIDGTVTISGTTYLVELKFTEGRAGSTDIDSLYKKVTTKADNTMGVMVSISGYSSTACREASGDRTPLLLLDHSHLYLVLGGVMSLAEVINRVRRHASQTGEAFLPASEFGL
jgi:hypothetical protein